MSSYQLRQGTQTLNLSGTIPAGDRLAVAFGTDPEDLFDIVESLSGRPLQMQTEIMLPDGGGVVELWKGGVVTDHLPYGKFFALDAGNPYLEGSSLKSVRKKGFGSVLGGPIGPPVTGGLGATVDVIDPEAEPVIFDQTTIGKYLLSRGGKRYELKNHLGNVLAVVTDLKLGDGELGVSPAEVDFYLPEVVELSDYYPFGWQLPFRHWNSGDRYRFAFQGRRRTEREACRSEGDDEWSGEEASVFFKYRVHDPRIGRFLSVDPLSGEYPWNSTYAFSENNVFMFVELEGLQTPLRPSSVSGNQGRPALNTPRPGGTSARGFSPDPASGPGSGTWQAPNARPGFRWVYYESGWLEVQMPIALDFSVLAPGKGYNTIEMAEGKWQQDQIDLKKGVLPSASGKTSTDPADYSEQEIEAIRVRALQKGVAGLSPQQQAVLNRVKEDQSKGEFQRKLAGIAKRYSNFECEKCADHLKKELQSLGLQGEILEIETNNKSSRFGGNIFSDSKKALISTNGRHLAIYYGDKVYDNVHPEGISFEKWKDDLNSPFGYRIIRKSF